MSANVEFSVQAFDEASSVFEEVSSSASECFSTITSDGSEAADSVDTSTTEMASGLQNLNTASAEATTSLTNVSAAQTTLADNQAIGTGGLKENALAIGQVSAGAAALVMNITGVENAEVSLDKAHLTLQKDTVAVQSAQLALNTAITDYGANSEQAKVAAEKLADAQDTVSVEQEKVSEAQRNLDTTIMMSAVTTIPSLVMTWNGLNTLYASTPALQTAVAASTDVLSTALDFLAANPIVLVIAGVAALAIGLYEAYEHCGPFRAAINDIGAVLGGAFKAAIAAVSDVIEYLWNDVFKPFGEFLSAVFVSLYLKPLEAEWNALSAGLSFIWKDILLPLADFFKGAFAEAINFILTPINMFETAINKVAGLVKPLTGFIGDLTGALKSMCFAHAAPAAEEFNTQISKSIELSNGLTQRLDPLKQGLLGVAGSTAGGSSASAAQQQTQTQQELIAETKNLANIMSKLTATAKNSGTLNQGIAQQMARRF